MSLFTVEIKSKNTDKWRIEKICSTLKEAQSLLSNIKLSYSNAQHRIVKYKQTKVFK